MEAEDGDTGLNGISECSWWEWGSEAEVEAAWEWGRRGQVGLEGPVLSLDTVPVAWEWVLLGGEMDEEVGSEGAGGEWGCCGQGCGELGEGLACAARQSRD